MRSLECAAAVWKGRRGFRGLLTNNDTAGQGSVSRGAPVKWERWSHLPALGRTPRSFGEMSGLVGRVKNVAKVRSAPSPSRVPRREKRGTPRDAETTRAKCSLLPGADLRDAHLPPHLPSPNPSITGRGRRRQGVWPHRHPRQRDEPGRDRRRRRGGATTRTADP